MRVPTFYAYLGSAQNLPSSWTKINLDNVVFDNFGYWSSVNNRWTPLIEGYYQLTGSIMIQTAATSATVLAAIAKNGGIVYSGSPIPGNSGGQWIQSYVSGLVYMNGSGDYVELRGEGWPANTTLQPAQTYTYMNGFLVSSP